MESLQKNPATMPELEERTALPRAQIRSSLLKELYIEVEVDHPEAGHMTTWAVNRQSRVRINTNGQYCLLTSR